MPEIPEIPRDSRKAIRDMENAAEDIKSRKEEILGEDLVRDLDKTLSAAEAASRGEETGDRNIDRAVSSARELDRSYRSLDTSYQIRKMTDVIRDAAPEDYERISRDLLALEKNLRENEEAAEQERKEGRVYVFVSWAMGEDRLREVIRTARGESNIVLAFRGYLPGETISEGNRRLRSLIEQDQEELLKELEKMEAREKDRNSPEAARYRDLKERALQGLLPPPMIQIDPAAFSDFGITHVPEVMYFVPGHESSTCQTVMRMDAPVGVCWLSRAHGLANPFFLPEKARTGSFGDLGTFGETVPVAEPDIREVMKAKMAGIDWKKKQEAAQKNFFRKRAEYGNDVLLEYAMYRRDRLIDPSVTAEEDITDKYGKVLLPAGTRVNPLDITPLGSVLAVFDPGRESEIGEIRKFLAEKGLDTSSENVVFIATRIPSSEQDDGWEFYTRLVHSLENHVFLLRDDVRKAFGIRATPSVVFQEPGKSLIRIAELGQVSYQEEEEPVIEPRGDRMTIQAVMNGMKNAGYDDGPEDDYED